MFSYSNCRKDSKLIPLFDKYCGDYEELTYHHVSERLNDKDIKIFVSEKKKLCDVKKLIEHSLVHDDTYTDIKLESTLPIVDRIIMFLFNRKSQLLQMAWVTLFYVDISNHKFTVDFTLPQKKEVFVDSHKWSFDGLKELPIVEQIKNAQTRC